MAVCICASKVGADTSTQWHTGPGSELTVTVTASAPGVISGQVMLGGGSRGGMSVDPLPVGKGALARYLRDLQAPASGSAPFIEMAAAKGTCAGRLAALSAQGPVPVRAAPTASASAPLWHLEAAVVGSGPGSGPRGRLRVGPCSRIAATPGPGPGHLAPPSRPAPATSAAGEQLEESASVRIGSSQFALELSLANA